MKPQILSYNTNLHEIAEESKRQINIGAKNKDLNYICVYFSFDLKQILQYLFSKLKYKEVPEGRQIIQSVRSLLETNIGNCQDFSILVGSIAKILGKKYKLRYCGWDGIEHVFGFVDNMAVDMCIGKYNEPNNASVTINIEPKYRVYKDIII